MRDKYEKANMLSLGTDYFGQKTKSILGVVK